MATENTFVTLDGLRGTFERGQECDPARQIDLKLDDGRQVRTSLSVLKPSVDGPSILPIHSEQFTNVSHTSEEQTAVIFPIIEESLEAGVHRFVTGTVKVKTHVVTESKTVNVPLMNEHVEVQRVRVDRAVDAHIAPYQDGDTLVIPVIEEVLVVEKRLVVREEIRITTRQTQSESSATVELRRTEALVERQPPETDSKISIETF